MVLFVAERELLAHRRVLAAFSPTLADLIAQAAAAAAATANSVRANWAMGGGGVG